MQLFRDIARAGAELDRPVVTLGNFDGVHLGHQALVEEVIRRARDAGRPAAAMTFDPHPVSVVAPGKAPPLLTTIEERAEQLERLGLDALIVQPFDRAFAALEPERFAREVLYGRLRPSSLVVGFNYGFGRGRSGGVDVLKRLGRELDVEVVVLSAVRSEAIRVSSTTVRDAVAAGELPLAAQLLGRPFEVTGEVIEGAHRGAGIGFPTANLDPGPRLLPPPGVYATRVRFGDHRGWPAATHLGPAPTFAGSPPRIEAHLLDFDGALYGERIGVAFLERLRGTVKFDGLPALQAQIARDVAQVRERLSTGG